jgi:hypothetical protein
LCLVKEDILLVMGVEVPNLVEIVFDEMVVIPRLAGRRNSCDLCQHLGSKTTYYDNP